MANPRTLNRLVRGEQYFITRYWSAFVTGSMLAHILCFALLSDVAVDFVKGLRNPEPAGVQTVYVSVIYPEARPIDIPAMIPVPYPPPEPAPPPAEGKETVAAEPPARRVLTIPPLPRLVRRPARAGSRAKVLERPSSPETPLPEAGDEGRAGEEQDVEPVKEEKTADAGVEIMTKEVEERFFDDVDEGAIVVIKGTEKAVVMPGAGPAASGPEAASGPRLMTKAGPPPSIAPVQDHAPGSRPGQTAPAHETEAEDWAETTDMDLRSGVFIHYSSPMPVRAPAGLPDYIFVLPEPLRDFSVVMGLPVMLPAEIPAVYAYQPDARPAPPTLATVEKSANKAPSSAGVAPAAPREEAVPHAFRVQPLTAFSLQPAVGDPVRRPVVLIARKDSPLPPVAVHRGYETPVIRGPKIIVIGGTGDEPGPVPEISIDSPKPGGTDQSIVDVAGTVTGEGIGSVSFSSGGTVRSLLVRDGSFGASITLREGRNVLSATAEDAGGRVARARVVVNYAPSGSGPKISFVSPGNDAIIDALEQREAGISGTVEGQGVRQVRLYLNKTVIDVPLKDGAFTTKTLLEAEQNTLYAEATDAAGRTSRSQDVVFSVVNLFPKDLTVRMEVKGSGMSAAFRHGWVRHPLAGRGAGQDEPRFVESGPSRAGVVAVGEAPPGIYTVGLSYEVDGPAEPAVSFHVTMYGHDPRRKRTRVLGPFRLSGKGYLPAVRLLLPECVFWEDDSWFSGTVEGSGYTIKYREPEGISWKEKR